MKTDIYFEKNNENTTLFFNVPTSSAIMVANAIKGMLALMGQEVCEYKEIDFNEIENSLEEDTTRISADEIFPEASPAMALAGLRYKEDLTQAEFAEKLGITQTMISEMESGKRAISVKMAKRIESVFGHSYKVFL